MNTESCSLLIDVWHCVQKAFGSPSPREAQVLSKKYRLKNLVLVKAHGNIVYKGICKQGGPTIAGLIKLFEI
jgi:hypothetical protein